MDLSIKMKLREELEKTTSFVRLNSEEQDQENEIGKLFQELGLCRGGELGIYNLLNSMKLIIFNHFDPKTLQFCMV